jgi:hypothetical protein
VPFVKIAQSKPNVLKFRSNDEHNAKPSMIGMRLIFVHKPVISPISRRDMITVNKGDDDLIVSTNDIVEYFSAINPKSIETSL